MQQQQRHRFKNEVKIGRTAEIGSSYRGCSSFSICCAIKIYSSVIFSTMMFFFNEFTLGLADSFNDALSPPNEGNLSIYSSSSST